LTKSTGSLTLAFYAVPLALSALGLNALNQVADYEVDKRSKPKRPLPSKELTPLHAIAVSTALFVAALALAAALNQLAPTLAFVALALAYSTHALPLRKMPLASNAVGGTLYGAIPFLAASAAANRFDTFFFALYYALAIVAATAKDFEDAEHDEAFGIKTLPVMAGKRAALAFIPLTLTFILVAALVTLFLSGAEAALLYACNAALALNLIFLYAVEKAEKQKISAVTQSWFANATVALVLVIQIAFAFANAI
jgi:geranylgeranylglycerol-phosphate geranylgeranyltransferase